jgi:putative FmdB family regulatory protein
MPVYEFKCQECGSHVTAYRSIAERHDAPICHGPTRRILTPTFVKVFNPYTTAVWDKEAGKPMRIRTQDEHRAFLQRNGFDEVGNDKSRAPLSEEEAAHNRAQQKDEAPFGWTEPDL